MLRLPTVSSGLSSLAFLLLSLNLFPAAADNTAYVNFSPAIYIFNNIGQSTPSQAPVPSPPSPPPPQLTTAITQWVYSTYNSPTPQVGVVTVTIAGQETSNTAVWVQPAPSPTVPFEPATPVATFDCSAIGEPWWACLSTERCSFDDVGSVACCPVGEYCRGVVSYGNGAGLRPGIGAGEISGGAKGVKISRDILIAASVLQGVVVGYWFACTAHEDGAVS